MRMGFIRDFVIKDEKKKKWIGWAVSIAEILIFLAMALLVKTEWQNGYDACKARSCSLCWGNTTPFAPQGANVGGGFMLNTSNTTGLGNVG